MTPVKKLAKNLKFHNMFRYITLAYQQMHIYKQVLLPIYCSSYRISCTILHAARRGVECDSHIFTNRLRPLSVSYMLFKKIVGEAQTLNSKSEVDMFRLPLFHDLLIPHVQRAGHSFMLVAEPTFELEIG